MKFLVIFLGGILFFLIPSNVNAQILAWDFNGNAGNEATVNSTTTDANLSVSSISRGSGVNASALGNAFSSTNFDGASQADAVTNSEYVQFTITPSNGFQVSLSTLDANFRRSNTGPTNFQWQYSLDGFATAGVNIGSTITYTLNTGNGDAQTQIALSAIPALQNVAFPNVITIRLYGWNASATGGTFAIGRLAGNDLAIGGTTAAITTAAPAEISGQVRSANGRGLGKVRVMLTGGSLTQPLYTLTSSFGYYRFNDITVGETYVVTVLAGKSVSADMSRIIDLQDNITDADFIVGENGN